MAISHADHDHPNTPAARAACRKQMTNGDTPLTGNPIPKTLAGIMNQALAPATLTVVPRKRGDGGVVKGLKAAKPDGDQGTVKGTKVKAYERPIKTAGDLPADVPAHFATTISSAWDLGYPVVEGLRLNDGETRILIGGPVAQVALVFNGADSGVFVRSVTSSITHRVDSGPQALALASGDDDWTWTSADRNV